VVGSVWRAGKGREGKISSPECETRGPNLNSCFYYDLYSWFAGCFIAHSTFWPVGWLVGYKYNSWGGGTGTVLGRISWIIFLLGWSSCRRGVLVQVCMHDNDKWRVGGCGTV